MTSIELRAGVDLVDIRRLQRLVEADSSFLGLGFTDHELTYCAGDPRSLAGRWAAKEAMMKALAVGIGRISPADVEVLTDTQGVPAIRLHGTALQRSDELGASGWSVSLSHEGEFAVAFVVGVIGGESA